MFDTINHNCLNETIHNNSNQLINNKLINTNIITTTTTTTTTTTNNNNNKKPSESECLEDTHLDLGVPPLGLRNATEQSL